MRIIGIESEGAGTNNQIRGIVLEGAKGENVPITRQELLKDNEKILHPKNYSSEKEFEQAVSRIIDNFCKNTRQNGEQMPEFVVLPYNQAGGKVENESVDLLSYHVKEAFAKNNVSLKTMVVASNVYDYKNVDLIHVGRHQINENDQKLLESNPSLNKKIVKTLGVPSNLSWLRIRQEANSPTKKEVLQKYDGKKTALFSLGGKTDNNAIKFTIKDADNLFKSALKLKTQGYQVIFTNSPRTPNDVTDYLFEKCQAFHMDFYNSKKIAENKAEAEANFRVYDGKHKKEFSQQAEQIGNIYPAVLNVCDFVVNTHDSFSYTSDAAALGIPSVVYTGNEIDFDRRPDCRKLFEICEKEGYALSLDEAMKQLSFGEKPHTKTLSGVAEQLIEAMTKTKQASRIKQNIRD